VTEPPFSETIAQGVREGDPDALTAVHRALIGPLTAYLHAQVLDRQLAEDLASETFLELVHSCRTITGGPFEIRGWLYRAAHHNLLDHRRYRARRPVDVVDTVPDGQDHGPSTDDLALAADGVARVRAALSGLSPDQAQVLTLRFLGGLSAPEVATILGKTEGAVRALQHRAVAAMARLLEDGGVSVHASPTPEPGRWA
jgi:RNA polymerase sigma-70 factor (ECF subfamily)